MQSATTDGAVARELQMVIGGKRQDARSGRRLESINPYTGKVWASVPFADADDVDDAVTAARSALEGPWGSMSATARGRALRRLAELIGEHAEELAKVETTDNGKLLREMRGQMAVLPEWFDYFGGLADKIEGALPPVAKPSMFAYTLHDPVGVVAAIVPWNSPLLLLAMKMAPALAAGCTVVAKPAEQTPVSALDFARLVEESGIPPGVFNVVPGDGETGRALTAHAGVDKISFTGSTEAGIDVMKNAAEHVAPVSLELGGKSPNIVFDDADVEAAANGVVAGIFAATGQTCAAGSRLFVQRGVYEELFERVAARARTIQLGNPLDPATEMGPIAFIEQLERVGSFVEEAVLDGAEAACGGRRSSDPALAEGYFYEPTILTGVRPEMRVVREEVFGPVLAVMPFDSEDEVVARANDTRYGLAAGIWTDNIRRAHRVAHQMRAGTVWINTYRTVSYNVPYGGYKQSGIGREGGVDAVHEYLETKAVWVNLSDETRDPFVMG